MEYEFTFKRLCSMENTGRLPMKLALLKQRIVAGSKICPVEGESFTITVSKPASNTRRKEAAKHCSGGCGLCGLLPKPQDFEEI